MLDSFTYHLKRETIEEIFQGSLAVHFDYTYDSNFPNKITSIMPKNPGTNAFDPNWQGWQYDYYQAGSAAPGALFHVYRLHDDGTTTDLRAAPVWILHTDPLDLMAPAYEPKEHPRRPRFPLPATPPRGPGSPRPGP